MTDTRRLQLGTDPIPRLLWTFALPAVIGLLINASYNLVDRIFIGNGIGALGLAGVAVSFPTTVLQMAFGLMVGIGGSVNFAVSLGQKKIPRAERIFTNAVMLIGLLAIIFFGISAETLRRDADNHAVCQNLFKNHTVRCIVHDDEHDAE